MLISACPGYIECIVSSGASPWENFMDFMDGGKGEEALMTLAESQGCSSPALPTIHLAFCAGQEGRG